MIISNRIPGIALATTMIFSLTGCIREEAPNAEADIIECILPDGCTTQPINYYESFRDDVGAYPLYVEVSNRVDVSSLSPKFKLTPGATISPASGSEHNFNDSIFYTVTSEDGKWQRRYCVFIYNRRVINIPSFFTFDRIFWEGNNKYQSFYEGEVKWCSGNGGFALTKGNAKPEEYPVYYDKSIGHTGGCAVLKTRLTGDLGNLAGKPIAAGSIHLGDFNIIDAMSDALKSTLFGISCTKVPTLVKGWYQYTSGPEYRTKEEFLNKTEDYDKSRKDHGNMTAVFYKSNTIIPFETLDGYVTNNNWNDPRIVAIARIEQLNDTDGWTEFKLELKNTGKEIDRIWLQDGGYGFSLIFSSSADAGNFCGAVGSTLLLDDIEIIFED